MQVAGVAEVERRLEIFCEKPIALTLAAAHTMVQAAEDADVPRKRGTATYTRGLLQLCMENGRSDRAEEVATEFPEAGHL
jgi:hypothetical protein